MCKGKPLISIIVPVYQADEYLADCVKSLKGQTYGWIECIANDDGSTDNSGELLDEYALSDCKFFVIHQPNAGQSCARNRALQISNGNYITYVDSDDYVSQDYCIVLFSILKECKVNSVYCHFIEGNIPVDLKKKSCSSAYQQYELDEENYYDIIYDASNSVGWCVCGGLYHRYIPFKYPFVEGRYYEDNDVAPKWLYESGRIAITEENLYFYRVNPRGTTKSGISIRTVDYLWALSRQIHFYRKIGYKKIARKTIDRYFSNFFPFYDQIKNASYTESVIRSIEANAWNILLKNVRLMHLKKSYNIFRELFSMFVVHKNGSNFRK